MSFDKHRTESGRRNGSFSSTDCYDPERRSIDRYDDVQRSRSYGVTRMMSNRSNQVPSGEPRTRYRRSRRVLPIHESKVKMRHFRLFSDSDIPDAPVSRREKLPFLTTRTGGGHARPIPRRFPDPGSHERKNSTLSIAQRKKIQLFATSSFK